MNVGINGRHLGPNKTGVGRYLINLLQQWQHEPRGHLFFVYTSSEQLEPEDEALFVSGSPIIHRRIPRPFGSKSFHLWYNWSLPRAMINDHIDWFFSPDYFCPPFLPSRLRRSMSIHDISLITHSEWFPKLYRWSAEIYSRRAATKADIVFTISNFSANELKKYYYLLEKKIVITPLAASSNFRPDNHQTNLPSVPRLDSNYFLFVGKIMNRRHVREMLLAFSEYLSGHPEVKTQFVVCGQDETRPPQNIYILIDEINRSAGRLAVLRVEHTSDQLLIQLYQQARAFFYLSSYEGFGLPVLEALACGTPTVTVRSTSIPEVAGRAAIYVNPQDITEIAKIMYQLFADQDWWEQKKQATTIQAKRFSWSQTAKDTLTAIEGYVE
ncbi:MAG: glycosyltransferase family 1 protein [Patescibacteria group bacterium]